MIEDHMLYRLSMCRFWAYIKWIPPHIPSDENTLQPLSDAFFSTDKMDSLVLVYFLSGALTFTTIVAVLLAFSVYKMKRTRCPSTGKWTFYLVDLAASVLSSLLGIKTFSVS